MLLVDQYGGINYGIDVWVRQVTEMDCMEGEYNEIHKEISDSASSQRATHIINYNDGINLIPENYKLVSFFIGAPSTEK